MLSKLAALASDFLGPAERPEPAPGRVLVVRPDALGDFVHWLPEAAALRAAWPAPDHHVVLVGNQAWTPLAQAAGVFDEVWPLDRAAFTRSLGYRRTTLARIRTGGFGTVIYPVYSREFLVGDAIVRASGAPVRIGVRGDLVNRGRLARLIGDRFFTRLIAAPGSRESERNLEVARALGADARPGAPHPLWAVPFPRPASGPYFVLAPGAASSLRRWPPERFAAVAGRIAEATGWECVVCGGPADAEPARAVLRRLGGAARDLVGSTGVLDFAAWIRHAALVVANETGAAHLAAAFGVPCVLVAGGGHFGRFVPDPRAESQRTVFERMPCYGCDWKCIYRVAPGEPAPCVARVGEDAVWRAIEGLIASPVTAPGSPPSP